MVMSILIIHSTSQWKYQCHQFKLSLSDESSWCSFQLQARIEVKQADVGLQRCPDSGFCLYLLCAVCQSISEIFSWEGFRVPGSRIWTWFWPSDTAQWCRTESGQRCPPTSWKKYILWSSQLDHCFHQENDWKHQFIRSWAVHFEWKSSILISNSCSCSQLIYVTSSVDVFESRYETALSIKPQSDTLAVEWTFYLNFHE